MPSPSLLALLFGVLFVRSALSTPCPSGWTASQSVAGKCYLFLNSSYNIFDMTSDCRAAVTGADIVAVANSFEMAELTSLGAQLGYSQFYVGAVFVNSTYVWIAKAGGGGALFPSNWPSPSGFDYAVVLSSGRWIQYASSSLLPFVCQYLPDSPASFPPQTNCPSGFFPSISVPGKCYSVNNVAFTYFDAARRCASQDGRAELISPQTEMEWMEATHYDGWLPFARFDNSNWKWLSRHAPPYIKWTANSSQETGRCARLGFLEIGVEPHDCADYNSGTFTCQLFLTDPSLPTPSACPAADPHQQQWLLSVTAPSKCIWTNWGYVSSFDDMRQQCKQAGGPDADLLSVGSYGEYDEARSLSDLGWYGLRNTAGTWQWISNGGDSSLVFWAPGQPDTAQYSNHTCAFMSKQDNGDALYADNGDALYAADCSEQKYGICQAPAQQRK